MANPQKENGFTPIANELLEKLAAVHLTPNEISVLFCVLRKTYGFRKKFDRIAASQIQQMTGLGCDVIYRSISSLKHKGLISKEGKRIAFQKDWEQWSIRNMTILPYSEANAPDNKNMAILQQKYDDIAIKNMTILPYTKENQNKILKENTTTKVKTSFSGKRENKEVLPFKSNVSLKDKPSLPGKKDNINVSPLKADAYQGNNVLDNSLSPDYIASVKGQYPDIDVDVELAKFRLSWKGQGNPRLVFMHWLDRAKDWKAKHSGPSKNGKAKRPTLRTWEEMRESA